MGKAIIVNNLDKKYTLFNNSQERLKSLFSPNKYGEDFYALRNVDFEAEQGEVIGFVGINGSGKSTLSNIIAGIVPETNGEIKVNGQAALIAVAAGLKNDLTGRDNIELKLLMLGFNKDEIKALEPSIIEFAELEKFIDQPVKSYSSGMKSRLGFAISVNVDPDVLLIDEALSVGDKAFAKKSLDKMYQFKDEGKTMVFVSHSLGQMKQFCEKILWLEYGEVKDFGPVDEILPNYEYFLKQWQKMNKKERKAYKQETLENRNRLIFNDTTHIRKQPEENKPEKSTYTESPVALIGEIRDSDAFIFKHPQNADEPAPAKDYMKEAFYIRKQAFYEDEIYYLISRQMSAIHGIIGWIKAEYLKAHKHMIVDYDTKEFTLNGRGNGYNMPWGRKKNRKIHGLHEYKEKKFHVTETHIVGKNPWYKGSMLGESNYVWMMYNKLK